MRYDTVGEFTGQVTSRADPTAPTQPLTLEIMDRTSRTLDTANEISSRLYQLRDRLFGSPPEATAGANASTKETGNFAGAYVDKAQSLGRVMADIDHISTDLANRL